MNEPMLLLISVFALFAAYLIGRSPPPSPPFTPGE